MLTKLAFKNAGKSIREYAVYFFTLALGVCVFYMFNSIHAQQAMLNLNAVQSQYIMAVMEVLSYVSVFVAVILGFLIIYANNFFIKRRKKELGIYMTLGMSKGKISAVLILETSLVALSALATGLFAGVFCSQFMSVITAKLFEVSMSRYSFVFAPDAAVKTVIYFGCVFLTVVLFNTVVIGRFKLIDLIYGARKNETLKIRNTKLSLSLFVISIGILARAYYLIITTGMLNLGRDFTMSIVLGTVGTLLFFYSLSSLVTVLLQHNKSLYYKDLNMFVVRQLGSKINTNCVSISVVCIALLFTIGIFATGYSMNSIINKEMDEFPGFDYTFTYYPEEGAGEEFTKVIPYIENNPNITSHGRYNIYSGDMTFGEAGIVLGENMERVKYYGLEIIPLSDYNNILINTGKQPIEIPENQYVLTGGYEVMYEAAKATVDSGNIIELRGTKLAPYQSIFDRSMNSLMMIVNDENMQGMTKITSILYVNFTDSDAEIAFSEQIDRDFKELLKGNNTDERTFNYSYSRAEQYAGTVASRAMISFVCIYIGLVFMMTSAAVLAIQQLSETADNKHRYELLSKLGADRKMLNKALFIQILCYFLAPLSLAVVHSVFGLKAVVDTMYEGARMNLTTPVIITSLFVGGLYLAYFIMTYSGSKAVIYKK